MKWNRYPEVCGALAGLVAAGSWFIGSWGPVSAAFQEAEAGQREALSASFTPRITEASARGDDLARINELHRLQKIPGVAAAELRAGSLDIQLSPVQLRRWRYRCFERAWTLLVFFGLLGITIGWFYRERRDQLLSRWTRLLKKRQAAYRQRLLAREARVESHFIDWVQQALQFAPHGLVLLDRHQRLAAYNPRAAESLQLTPDLLGSHWLDLQKSPTWGGALRESLEHPGESFLGPRDNGIPVSILTYSGGPEGADSTWLIVHD